jgi:hypothetical protein
LASALVLAGCATDHKSVENPPISKSEAARPREPARKAPSPVDQRVEVKPKAPLKESEPPIVTVPAAKIEKERAAPPEPEPVSLDGTRYESMLWGKTRGLGQNGGYLVAIDEASGKELWVLKVYDVVYEKDKEEDKQDVFITSLSLDPDQRTLRVTNEKEQVFLVDLKDRKVKGPIRVLKSPEPTEKSKEADGC